MTSEHFERVSFKLDQDETGYPPSKWERLWAVKQKDGSYLIDNAPFFVRDVSVGDHVEAVRQGGELTFKRVVAPSGNSLLRVAVKNPKDEAQIMEALQRMGCKAEKCDNPRLASVVVPPDKPIRPILEYLDRQYAMNKLDFEEAAMRHKNQL